MVLRINSLIINTVTDVTAFPTSIYCPQKSGTEDDDEDEDEHDCEMLPIKLLMLRRVADVADFSTSIYKELKKSRKKTTQRSQLVEND